MIKQISNIIRNLGRLKDITLPLSKFGQAFDMGIDTTSGASGRPSMPYNQVDWVWRCVNLILDVCQDIQPIISAADDNIIESGPAFDFFFSNPDTSFASFLRDTSGFLLLHREAYWIFTETDKIVPTKITVVGRDQITPEVKNGILLGYKFQDGAGREIPLFIEDVWPLINFNPDNRFRGAGPLDAGKLAISSAYQATQYNEATMANGARIGTILTVPAGVKLDDNEIKAMRAQFEAQQAGARNAGKTFIATGGIDVKTVSQTMAELQMIDLRKFDAAAICAMFGVPAEMVGLNPEAQYAHGPASLRFFLYTISPLLSFIASGITAGILRRFRFRIDKHKSAPQQVSKIYCGAAQKVTAKQAYRLQKHKAISAGALLFFWFDTDSHPALQDMLRDRAAKMLEFNKAGIPINPIIDAGDLPFEHVPWGDDWFIPMGQVPARWILEGGPEQLIPPPLPEGGEEEEPQPKAVDDSIVHRQSSIVNEKDDSRRSRIWLKYIASFQAIELQYASAVRRLFLDQRRELIAKLEAALKDSGYQPKIIDNRQSSIVNKADTSAIVARVVFDIKKENGKLKVFHRVFYERSAKLGAAQAAFEAGQSVQQAAASAAQQLNSRTVRSALSVSAHKISKVNSTTADRIANTLRRGLDSGENLSQLTGRIKDTLDTTRPRAQMIARTQVSGAVSAGRQAGMQAAGIEMKGWLSARDKNVRPEHRKAEADYASGIPINQSFVVGGEALMYPGDPSGSAAMIINCRCMQIALAAAGKSFDLDYHDRAKILSETDIKPHLTEVQNAT